jgi:aminoglycoside phosphotransferase family enzyme/predicted kinase
VSPETDLARCAALVDGLRDPAAYPHPADHVEVIETHISWVVLAGDYAYKLKKPVNLGFLDFSTRARRRLFCREEVRINRRLAPTLYLGVIAVRGSVAQPRLGGGGPALEYAVKMRRFPQSALLTNRKLDEATIDRIAERVARFHAEIPSAPQDSACGTPEAVLAPMLHNFDHILSAAGEPSTRNSVARLRQWTRERFEVLRPCLAQRRRDGFVRECHGDMHRGNIALDDGEPIIFDGIEFSPTLRWIDTMNELAFLVMDLREIGKEGLARRLINRYMEIAGDYEGLAVIRFYQVYRAMVRAKVIAIRMRQPGADRLRDCAELHRYLELAKRTTRPLRPRMFITHGLSGSGKTELGHRLREHLPLIQLRSDIERKRLFHLPLEIQTAAGVDAGIYTKDATRRTYERLVELAGVVLASGYSVMLDATFLRRDQRDAARALADRLGSSFTILALDAPLRILRERIRVRLTTGADASEAQPDILEAQIARREPLGPDERTRCVHLDTERGVSPDGLMRRLGLD